VGDAKPGWLLDEVTSAGRENLDPEHVARYDTKEDAGALAEVAELVALGLTSASTGVDIGVGTGQLALAVASSCRRVVAVDVSPVMLAALRRELAAQRATNVDVVEAGFLTCEHEGDPADEARIEAWCATGGADVASVWTRAELEEHVRDEHSPFTWLLEPMIERSSFAIEHAVRSDDGIFAKYVARAI